MKKALVILAHPDDESYGPAGTIRQLADQMEVVAVVLCSGKRPGAEHVSYARQSICLSNLTQLGVQTVEMHKNDDTQLRYPAAAAIIEQAVMQHRPSIVFTHDGSDLHMDHRVVNEATLVACRPTPTCSVQSLYTYEIPGSSEWGFGQYGMFIPSVYVNITQHIDMKQQLLQRYQSETYEYPDSRSVESMRITAAMRGKVMGMEYAEAFRLVYARCHTIL